MIRNLATIPRIVARGLRSIAWEIADVLMPPTLPDHLMPPWDDGIDDYRAKHPEIDRRGETPEQCCTPPGLCARHGEVGA